MTRRWVCSASGWLVDGQLEAERPLKCSFQITSPEEDKNAFDYRDYFDCFVGFGNGHFLHHGRLYTYFARRGGRNDRDSPDSGPTAGLTHMLTARVTVLFLLSTSLACAYSVLTHEAIVDSLWDAPI